MQHLAILDKKRKLLEKIRTGEKTIESRWYKSRRDPYGKIHKGDIIYFKDSGEKVTIKAKVSDVKIYADITEEKVRDILKNYASRIGISQEYKKEYLEYRYIILIFLEDVKDIAPFDIDKSGYGLMSAWICVDDIGKIRKVDDHKN